MRPSHSSFKVLYESSEWPVPFAEERNAKLLSKMRENLAKYVSVENRPPEVFYKKKWSYKFRHTHRKAPVLEPLFSKVSFLFKKILQGRWLPVNIANFLRTPILKKICEWLFLSVRRSDSFLSTPFVWKTTTYDSFQRRKN